MHTEIRVRRRRHGQNRLHTPPEVVEAVRILNRVCTDEVIASSLNRAGLRTGHGNRWTRERAVSLRGHFQIPTHTPQRQALEGWLNLTDAAAVLGVSAQTLRLAVERGMIEASHPLNDGPWVIHRHQLEGPSAKNVIERAARRRGRPAVANPDQPNLDFSNNSPEEAV